MSRASRGLCAVATAVMLALVLLALVAVMSKPAKAATDRLPDLGMDRITNIQIQKTNGKRLLRFTARVVNVGDGPFEARGSRPNRSTPTMNVRQRIFNNAGGSRTRKTNARMYFAGDGHNHWHLKNLQHYGLTKVGSNREVRKGAKQGFCFYDNYDFGSTRAAYYTRKTSPPACGKYPSDLKVTMGLSRGWGDTYSWKLVGQYINLAGVPNGRYRLRAKADPGGWFKEQREKNNSTWVDLRIKGSRVSVIRYGPSAKPI
jgi:hypothetical protein